MAIGTDQAINAPRLLLIGASSQIGVFAIPHLLRNGFHVLAVSRNGKPAGYPVFEQVQWLNEDEAVQASCTCQTLLSAGPMGLAQKFLLISQHIQTAIIFSSSSVATKQESGNSMERDQIKGMRALESELRLLAENRGLKLVIFRPTLIYGCGLDTNISRLASWIRRYGFMPVNGKASGLRQPVHADDLATVAVSALLSKNGLPPVLYLSGGESLSYSDMVSKIFMAYRKPVRLVRLPQWLFVLLVNIAKSINNNSGINSEMVRRQRMDLVFDDTRARQLLNYEPRIFTPAEADFSLPNFQSFKG